MNKFPTRNKFENSRNLFLLAALFMVGFVAAIHLQALLIFVAGWLLGACFMSASMRAKSTVEK